MLISSRKILDINSQIIDIKNSKNPTITKSKLILLFLHGRKTTVIISQKHRDVKCPRSIITHLHGDFKCFFKLFCKKYEKI